MSKILNKIEKLKYKLIKKSLKKIRNKKELTEREVKKMKRLFVKKSLLEIKMGRDKNELQE